MRKMEITQNELFEDAHKEVTKSMINFIMLNFPNRKRFSRKEVELLLTRCIAARMAAQLSKELIKK